MPGIGESISIIVAGIVVFTVAFFVHRPKRTLLPKGLASFGVMAVVVGLQFLDLAMHTPRVEKALHAAPTAKH